ncbi:MAG: ribbon-helix-helix domain-containing protein [Deltaproteobacteria bacterium]|nr:ribbon-helix-helix domain-containing protein [Deltaproteobacteria bacterium]
MPRNKVSTTVYITAEQNEKLKELHARTKVPVAEFIRQGIDLVLERYREHLPGQVALFDSETPPGRVPTGLDAPANGVPRK